MSGRLCGSTQQRYSANEVACIARVFMKVFNAPTDFYEILTANMRRAGHSDTPWGVSGQRGTNEC